MSYIPNVRKTHTAYYEGNLQKSDNIAYKDGYDYAVDGLDIFFDNLDEYDWSMDKAFTQEIFDEIKKNILHWMEMNRNEMVVALIESEPAEKGDKYVLL